MISSGRNGWMKDMRRLRRSKGDGEGRTLLEGPHLLAEAVAAATPLEAVFATPDTLDDPALAPLFARLQRAPLAIEPSLLGELADADSPRGLVAIARLPERSWDSVPTDAGALYVYADGIQDPGNFGALARVAEAAGAAALFAGPGCARRTHPRALRASAGSLLRLPTLELGAPSDTDARLGSGARWATLVPRGGESLWTADLGGTLVVAVGAEGPGVSAAVLERATLGLTIPMASTVESLNATVSASIVLFERARRGHAG